MVAHQLITITPTGEVQSLKFPKGKGVDLRPIGAAKISRETLIEWDEVEQVWFIKWLRANAVITLQWHDRAALPNLPATALVRRIGGTPFVITFDEYEDAVAYEVAFIQAARLTSLSYYFSDVAV